MMYRLVVRIEPAGSRIYNSQAEVELTKIVTKDTEAHEALDQAIGAANVRTNS